jgi:PleD family two-component response regulator
MEHGGSDRRRGGPDRRGRREKTKILIVDDHPLFRLGIRYILEKRATRRWSARPTMAGALSRPSSRPRPTSS